MLALKILNYNFQCLFYLFDKIREIIIINFKKKKSSEYLINDCNIIFEISPKFISCSKYHLNFLVQFQIIFNF